MPAGADEGGVVSGNFQISAPIISLAGRGVDINLNLIYNSRLWNKSGSEVAFDIDQNWLDPAPGWSLGFGKLVYVGPSSGYLYIDANGLRHSFVGDIITNLSTGEVVFKGKVIDGGEIYYQVRSSPSDNVTVGWVKYPNGLKIGYGGPLNPTPGSFMFPWIIEDANGNQAQLWYDNQRLQRINDTLGRDILFHYDNNNLLTAVTMAGLKDANGLPVTRTLVRLHYKTLTLNSPTANYGFASNLTPIVRNQTIQAIDAIYYPASQTGYWFGDTDSYSSFGMIAKVIEQRQMAFSSTGLNDQGQVTPGLETRRCAYDYPLTATSSPPLSDVPSYSTETETWVGMNTGPAVTVYGTTANIANPPLANVPTRRTEVVSPDGTHHVKYSYNFPQPVPGAPSNPEQYKNGLTYQEEVLNHDGHVLQRAKTVWGRNESSPEKAEPRPVSLEVTDELGQAKRTQYDYTPDTDPWVFNQVSTIWEYALKKASGEGGELLRKTVISYNDVARYPRFPTSSDQRNFPSLVNLISTIEVYSPQNKRLSRTEYKYDEGANDFDSYNIITGGNYVGSLANTPGVVNHSYSYDPYSLTGIQQQLYLVTVRGNLTSVKTYADADALAGAVEEHRIYDITGNLITHYTNCSGGAACQQEKYVYTSDTQYAYPNSRVAGLPDNAQARAVISKVYDFNTGLELSATDANGRQTLAEYTLETWRPHKTTASTGAYTIFTQDDAALSFAEDTYTNDGGVAARSVKTLNGLGQLRREEVFSRTPSGQDQWDVLETMYDVSGRPWKQSIPFHRSDPADSVQWTESVYDDSGRVTKTIEPDGSQTQTDYNEESRPAGASPAPGHTVQLTDPWGRQRWGLTDSDDRLIQVIEPNPNGDGAVGAGGLSTAYTYDALGNMAEIIQGEQHRKFEYDSLGRLLRQKVAESAASLDSTGTVSAQGAGQWSDVFAYDELSNLKSHTDARGVKTLYCYSSAGCESSGAGAPDALNRLFSISYDAGGATDVLPAPKVSYTYVTTGDVTRVKSVSAEGVNIEEFDYDNEGRVKERKSTTFNRPAVTTNFIYDSLNRLSDTYYPQAASGSAAPRKIVTQEYNQASRLKSLKVDGTEYAADITYNAAGQTASLRIGTQLSESYEYEPSAGLLNRQTVTRGGQTLLDLSYGYAGVNGRRTGQITSVVNNRDHNKDHSYEYDPLGRLSRASAGGAAGAWVQRYFYDQFGNRSSVLSQATASFVANQYRSVLAGDPDSEGLAALDGTLRQAYGQGQAQFLATAKQVVAGFFDSQRYADRHRSDREYVYDLYKAYLDREPDQSGWDAWTATVASSGRTAVRQGFADSAEFSARVSGLYPGLVSSSTSISAPSGLTVSSSNDTQIRLSWTAPSGLVDHYRVERCQNGTGSFTFLSNSATTDFIDAAVSTDTAYLYRVRAVSADGGTSPVSNVALGTAVTFTDDPIVVGVTPVKADHFLELRRAVNAARRLAGMTDATWTDTIQPGVTIKAVYVQELRDRLGEALAALGMPAAAYTDPTLATGAAGTPIKKVHVEELRKQVARLSGVSSGGGGTTTAGAAVPADGRRGISFDPTTNRINSYGWQYDAAGNQTRALSPSGAWLRFKYDAANRLVKVADDNGQTLATYTYGAGRRRLVTQHGNESSNLRTYYIWGAEEVLSEFAEDDASPTTPQLKRNYVYLSSTLIATQDFTPAGEVDEFHHPDQLSTRLVTNPSQNSSFEQATLPFGTDLYTESTGSTNRRFTSYDRSGDTGLDYASNRNYDSLQGRFTQADPAWMNSVDLFSPQSLNAYAYCGNDPVNGADRSGLDGNISSSIGPFPFPGQGGGGGGGGLSGIFGFGFGFLSWLFGRHNSTVMHPIVLRPPSSPFSAFQHPTPQPPPTSTTVAVAGIYSERYENDTHHQGSNAVFYQRALASVGGKSELMRRFSNGVSFLESVSALSAQVSTIGRLNIFSHAYPPGIIGESKKEDDYDGLYIGDRNNQRAYKDWYWTRDTNGQPYRFYYGDKWPMPATIRRKNGAMAEDFVQMILSGQINIARGGDIVFYGCNTDAIASHIQWMLKDSRPDIRVTGATGSVTMENPNYAETGPGRFNTWTGANHDQIDGRSTRKRYR